MEIKWTDGMREVPGIGLINTGDVRVVPDELGVSLIKQKQAIKVQDKIGGKENGVWNERAC